jgi:DNA replication initiation complex subunit (GINS family)
MADETIKSKSSKEETSAAASAPASDTGVRADAAPSKPVKQVRKVKFAVEQKSPTLEIGHGEYSRKFVADDQPFEVDDEEFTLLIGTGLFVAA